MSQRRHSLVEAVVWWMLLIVGYLMLVSPLSGGEVVLGAVLSAMAASAAVVARRMSNWSFALPRGWARVLVQVPATVLSDTVFLVRRLGPELLRREASAGCLRALPLPDQADQVREESVQAVTGLLLSLSPGSVVVDSNAGPPTLLVHAVRAQPSARQRSVRR